MATGNVTLTIKTDVTPRLEVCAHGVHHRKIKDLELKVGYLYAMLAVTFALALADFVVAVNA